MSQYQSGGQRKRGTCDNQIMMNAVIDQNRRLKKKTYLHFADRIYALTDYGLKIV